MEPQLKLVQKKPVISWWKSGDPCYKIPVWENKLTEVNIIHTKQLTDEFIAVCLRERNRIFLHVSITGMGKTVFEPGIPSVKETFLQIKKLIAGGFLQKQILVIVNPILPNENGLNALKLLLKVFTEFRALRLRFVRFTVLSYAQYDKDEKSAFTIANRNIASRPDIKKVGNYLIRNASFWKDYYNLINSYQSIITVDKGDEAIIGIRELIVFGYKNEWFDEDHTRSKLIEYEKGNKYKPLLNLLSDKHAVRCKNRCLLCPWQY